MGNQSLQENKTYPTDQQQVNYNNSYDHQLPTYNDNKQINGQQIVLQILNMTKKTSIETQEAQIILQSQQNIEDYFLQIQRMMSKLYMRLSEQVINKLNEQEMSENQASIYLAQQILHTIFSILKVAGKFINFETNNQFFQKINDIQLWIIRYLKKVHSKGQKNYVPIQLMKQFINLDMIEQPQFDILEHKKIYFGSEDPENIAKTLKKMLNFFINQTQQQYSNFQKLLQDNIFIIKEGQVDIVLGFQFTRAISQTVSKVDENNISFQDIKNPDLLHILTRWIDDIKDYVWNPTEELLEKDYYKFITNQQKLLFTHISPEEIQQIINQLQYNLKSHQDELKQKIKSLKQDLSVFNWNMLKIFTQTTRQQKFVSEKDAQIIRFSMNNSFFLRWILFQKIKLVIKMLVKTGKDMQNSMKIKMDLIKFNIPDMFRAQASVSKKQLIQVFSNMKKLEHQGKIKIVRIINNLQTSLSDVQIVFKFSNCELFCQINLFLSQSNRFSDKKYKSIQFLNNFYDTLQKSQNGVMYELAIIINNKHSIVDYNKKLAYAPIPISLQKCKQNHPSEIQKFKIQKKPFICTGCINYYDEYENLFATHKCKKCFYFLCYSCMTNKNKQELKQNLYQSIREIILSSLTKLQQKQMAYLKKADLAARSRQIALTDDKLINQISNFFRDGKIIFLNDLGKQRIKKKTLVKLHLDSQYKYGTLAKFFQGELKLYSFSFRKTQQKIQFGFDHIQLNRNQYIYFNTYDFIILHKDIKQQNISNLSAYQILYLYQLPPLFTHLDSRNSLGYSVGISGQTVCLVFDDRANRNQNDRQIQKLSIHELRSHLPQVQQTYQIYELRNKKLIDKHLGYFSQIRWLQQIKELNLSKNYISDISVLLRNLLNIQILNVCLNQISTVEFEYPLSKLKKFLCSDNCIYNLNGLRNIENVQVLNCKNNYIKQLQNVKMSQLKQLDLSSSSIENNVIMNNDDYPNLKILKLTFSDYYQNEGGTIQFNLNKLRICEISYIKCSQFIINAPKLERLVLSQSTVQQFIIQSKKQLTYLQINYCDISNLSTFLQYQMSSLLQLKITDTNIEQLPILKMPKLKLLSLSSNNLANLINLEQSEIPRLETLECDYNQIQIIPKLKCPQIILFRLFGSYILRQIQSIKDWDMPRLKILQLSQLTPETKILPLNFGELTHISINCGYLPKGYKFSQPKLQNLKIQNTKFEQFPEINSPELKQIELSQCKIDNYQNLSKLASKKLQVLRFWQCSSQNIVFPSFSAHNLNKLSIILSNLKDISSFTRIKFPKLQLLQLNDNKIQTFPVINAPNLKQLFINNNCLKDLQSISTSQLPLLQKLYLNGNQQFSEIPIIKLNNLKYLDLRRCNISQINLNNLQIPSIQQLFLYGNKVKTILAENEKCFPKIDYFPFPFEQLESLQFIKKLKLQNLTKLQLNNINENIKTVPQLNFPKVTYLSIISTKISNIDNLTHSNFPLLQTLQMHSNNFDELPILNFSSLKNLKLNYKQGAGLKLISLQNLSESKLPQLKRVQTQNNSIKSLPLLNFQNLQQVFIMNNQISDISRFLSSNLPSLSLINICQNPINFIPIGQNLKPSQIYMQKAKVTNFQPLIRYAPESFRFYYTDSQINQDLPVLKFSKANRVQFENCGLISADNLLKHQLGQAQQISFVDNKIEQIGCIDAPKLLRLFLNRNKIKKVDNLMKLSNLPKIKMFSLQSNCIEDLIDFPFTNVQQVFLSHNLFKDISFMSKYQYVNMKLLVIYDVKVSKISSLNAPNIQRLFFNKNQIVDLKPLEGSKMPRLYQLVLSDNKINNIQIFQKLQLPSLTILNLNKNQISTLVSLENYSNISNFSIKQNPIQNLHRFLTKPMNSLYHLNISLSSALDSQKRQQIKAQIYKNYSVAGVFDF